MPNAEPAVATYIDSHCHYQASISFADFFAAIAANMAALQHGSAHHSAICLVEMQGSDWFSLLVTESASGAFSVEQIDDQTLSVKIGQQKISVYRAHQVNSSENIEVIVVGHKEQVPAGLPLAHYLRDYSEAYLVILPWGVGKWLGRRGKLVTDSMQRECQFVLGDNGGRPYWWSSVPQFSKAAELNMPVLAGSDPLAVNSYVNRVASFGQVFDGVFNDCSAWINGVKNLTHTPPVYGCPSTTLGFLADQFGLRLNKFFKRA